MGRLTGKGFARVLVAVATAGVVAGLFGPAPAGATPGGSSTPTAPTVPAAPTTTTLPSLPKVSPTYTDGQTPQTLLSNAISLSSVGLDDSALLAGLAATQGKLDADAVEAREAQAESDAASAREAAAQASLKGVQGEYTSMAGAVRQAVLYLYTTGAQSLVVSPTAGALALYAQDYADSTLGPYGVLARRQALEQQRSDALSQVGKEAKAAAAASAKASKALADQQLQLGRLKSELDSASAASASAVAADHVALAAEAGKDLVVNSDLQFTPKTPLPTPVSTTPIALTWAFAELGKEYVWGATGPDTFDCSGLTQFVWKAAGVQIPRVAADQDAWAIPVPLSGLLPGDLVFFGTTDIHHVGIYIGDGLMINAPHTGTVVQVSSIWWSDLAGFGRVHYPGTPVPPHDTPTPSQPAPAAVLQKAGKVPSQTKPPAGWKPAPGSTTPIRLGPPSQGSGGPSSASSTTSTTSTTTVEPTTSSAPPGDPLVPDTTTILSPGSTTTTAVTP